MRARDIVRGGGSLGLGLAAALGAATPVSPALLPASLLAVGRLPVLPAGAPSPPPARRRATLGATVPRLGMGGSKAFLAPLEQTPPLSRPTSPLTAPRFAASLEWAQGSCELPTAKPRVRSPSYSAPRRLYLPPRPSWSIHPSTVNAISRASKHLTGCHSPKRIHFGLVPGSPKKWYPPRPLPIASRSETIFPAGRQSVRGSGEFGRS
jgi:hypothetical protein